ncbi:uncharacterized protein LOC110446758 [Mizuhopecten yessoensis]|uniref:Uncharacterized protein n=1 Tax=Mizuhopecten yessoensis TaxID=6573 RepID=A0A210QWP3_MIZYE|nr:uncharacterized protein LOC110446758 [Mizuhopecten yessoensis]OWF53165.1 hypothetical protein KP79_PYT06992 [Mizuhopecten yessoensis]
MTRKYTDNELLALTRNRREAKALRTRMEKLDEERAQFHDVCGKEKTQMKSIRKEHRRSSGSSPFLWDDPQVRSQSVDPSLLRRYSKPWSICPSETTHNIVFKEVSLIRPFSSINAARPKSEPNRKRRSLTARTVVNGQQERINKESPFCAREEAWKSSNSNEFDPVDKSGTGNLSSTPLLDRAQERENTSIVDDINKRDGTERRDSSGDVFGFSQESTTEKDPNGNMTDSQISRNEDVANGNQNDVNRQQSSNQNDTTKPRTLKKKRKSMSKRPSTAFTTVLPSVSETQNQEALVQTDKIKASVNAGLEDDPASTAREASKGTMNGNIYNTEGDIRTAVEEFSSIHLSENVPSVADKEIVEINPAISFDVNLTHDDLPRNDTDKFDRERPVTRIGTERQISRVSATASTQHGEPRPSTVVGGEVLDFESLSDAEDGDNVTYFKGQRLRNYVSPQRRYKQDPFRFKRREKLFTKLAKDNPDIVEEVRRDSVKVELSLSKSARARLLEQLVTENSQRETSRRLAQKDKNMNGRIKKFIGSISYLCNETDERSKQMHPLLA